MAEEMPVDDQSMRDLDVRDVVRQAIEEFVHAEHRRAEPAYKAELQDERKRRENLESRLNQLIEENRSARAAAEEADRNSQIRSELQRLGVAKVDLAFRAVKDEIVRGEDGRLQTRGPEGNNAGLFSRVRARESRVSSGEDRRWKRCSDGLTKSSRKWAARRGD